MEINLIPDSSVSSAPAGFTAAVQAAAKIYEQDIPGNYTVNITYGWGTFDNVADDELTNSNSSAFSLGGPDNGTFANYATIMSWLTADATLSDQMTALASLPASYTDLPGEADDLFVSSAQEKALGVFTGNEAAVNGSIGFNTADTSNISAAYLEEAALQEIGHALGWGFSIQELFRYSAPGQYEWAPFQPAYFSVDGGKTDLANYLTSGDSTLFSDVGQNDPFALPFTGDSSTATLTNLDLEVLNDIGFGGTLDGLAAIDLRRNDYVGNGVSDIIWQNDQSGATYEWLMANQQRVGNVYLGDLSGWRDVASGDFNGDGVDGVLWQNQTSGVVYEWSFSNGQHAGSDVYLGNLSGWTEVGTGAFDGPGSVDALWQNQTSGAVYEWSFESGQHVTADDVYLGRLGGWTEAGTGDFTGNGASDVLWQNASSGAVYEWQMANGENQSSIYLGNVSGYTMVGAGDFNGDGITDLLWKSSTTGEVWEWRMNSAGQNGNSIDLGNLTGYNAASVGDYNGSGTDGIVWQGASAGDTWLWTMSNGQHTASTYLGATSGWQGH